MRGGGGLVGLERMLRREVEAAAVTFTVSFLTSGVVLWLHLKAWCRV